MTMATFGARAEPLAPYTSLRIGGPADFFLRVATEKDLLEAIQVARENELPVFVLGGGTNLLVADRGIRGVVLQNAFRESSVDGDIVTASSGTELAHVAAVAARSGIEGLEWMATVPGTARGAVHGHAGDFAGRLIEAAGLKGRAIGGAMVSPKHANFIVNANGATASDVHALMTLVQREVAKRFNVKLVPEVELVGEW